MAPRKQYQIEPKDYYKTLEVNKDATQEDMKNAYRQLAKKYHPDNNSSPEAAEKMKEINIAKDELKITSRDAEEFNEARTQYDKWQMQYSQAQQAPSQPQPQSYSQKPTQTQTSSYSSPPPSSGSQSAPSAPSGGGSPLPSGGSSVAGSIASKATGTVASKAARSAAGKAASGAASKVAGLASGLASAGLGTALTAATLAAQYGGDLGKGIAGTAAAITSLLAGSISLGVSAVTSNTIIAMVLTPIVVAFFLVIINTSAYLVPPDSGFVFQDEDNFAAVQCLEFSGPWPETALNTELLAADIIFSFGNFGQTLCASGPIQITYNPVQFRGYGGFVSAGRVSIYPNGTGSLGNTLYTLAHELGHVYDGRTGRSSLQYRDGPWASEGRVCTYPVPSANVYSESYAEMIALYIGGSSPPTGFATGSSGSRISSCLGGNFRTAMPNTWRFAHDNIFLTTGGRW